MRQDIRDLILDLNPWQRDPGLFEPEMARQMPMIFVPRELDILGRPAARQARLIVGPRQAGKSTLVWSSLRQRDSKTVLFLNAEELLIQEWARSAAGMVRDLASGFPWVTALFVDEAQWLENAGLTIKGLVDARRGLEIIVTGSSSYHLGGKVRESLAGRAERGVLLPLSCSEILAHETSPTPAARRQRAREIARRMMVVGGYPGVWFSDHPEQALRSLVEALILRDASDRFRIQRPDAMRRLLQLVATQSGQMVNLAELAAHLGISAPTVREYLGLLEESWILRLVPAFAGGRRREITSAARVHFFDPGVRNALLGALSPDVDRRPDRGALAEGLAFAEITKVLPADWVLHYWRAKGGAEVDFVLVRGDRRIAVEVKSKGRERLSPSARSFIESYGPEAFLIVEQDGAALAPDQVGPTRVGRVAIENLAAVIRVLLDLPLPNHYQGVIKVT